MPRLVEEQGGKLYALARQFCGDPDEAEDLVQETFMQAWRKWDQFEGRSSPATWLYTIASRICQRLHRKRSGEPEKFDSIDANDSGSEALMPIVPEENDPLARQIQREGRERVEAAINMLPQDFRMPLVLKEIVGFSLAEVAAVLDMKEATVKTRLHRARLRVRDALGEAVPHREGAPPPLSREICLDLLESKQEHLDKKLPFEFPAGVVCERCKALFASMDITLESCADLGEETLPEEIRDVLYARLRLEK